MKILVEKLKNRRVRKELLETGMLIGTYALLSIAVRNVMKEIYRKFY